ncbi:hypothetical protein [Pseudomonas cichorii]|uniref:Uncharacterized protein n=1 Tax=Pseudomonas cichorii TaxID=36746 RepID=A0A3M4W7U0_PSECI|nr:hypothetical protein [Pseudomonas cichorii]AHF66821.1 hypothetical protein PCH70_16680 [Pseudomonas cichorii JBC1]QVE18718.1 hypothetical protein KGD89_08335 [Pseudomonas cichorii]RMR60076.1 hypothetical protein ALP84_01324 [Pseudomonas cichorii]SDO02479.1 hypothetical protein SAMN05216599_10563 [Pseudomonas cichorii]GFM91532.1 hypothetical protein PSCICP_15040 [Pseudomonas cichorii]
MQHQPQLPIIIADKNAREQDDSLKAPDVAVAFHDEDTPGLLPISELTKPVIVDLEVWAGAQPGYTYSLHWDGETVGPEKPILGTHRPGDPLTLEIPVGLLTEGTHTLQYQTFNPESQVRNESNIFNLVIDLTAPGKPELSAILFPPEVQNGLTAAELAQLGGKLDVQIAGYTGMAKHDVVQTYWGTTIGPQATVTEDDMGLDRVAITFTRAFLESLGETEQLVKYKVFDRAGNASIDSNPVPITLKLQDIPANFPAPIIDPGVGTLIDYAEAQAGVQVDIPKYPGASPFDMIRLFWGQNNPLVPVALPPGNENEDIVLSLRIPYETLNQNPVGSVQVFYEVTRQLDLAGTSLSSTIDVFLTLPVPTPLETFIVQGTSVESPNTTDNFIDEEDYELNALGVVKWNTGFAISDNLNLFWGDQQKLQWYQIRATDIAAARDLLIPIDNAIMRAQGTGAEIPVYYTVTRAGNPNPVKCPVQLVTVRSKEELPGGSEGLDGPPFKLNDVGFIAPILNPNGADLHIAPYINIDEGQTLFLTFKGFDKNNNPIDASNYTADRTLDKNDVANGYTFTVPDRNLRILCTGFAEASFRVEPPAGSNQSAVTSKVTRAPVNMLDSVQPTCPIPPFQ